MVELEEYRILSEERMGSGSTHVDTAISMKLTLFSTGVILKDLKKVIHTEVRGYKLPTSFEDINPFRKGN